MRVRVFHNARAGTGKAATGDASPDAIAAAFAEAGVTAELLSLGDVDLAASVGSARAGGFDAIVAAGGDGPVNAVAAAVVDTDLPLGVLPMGTLNHFAKDLGLPQRLADAARVIAAGRTAAVDVGDVNGRAFVNNSSIGLYPHIVSKRERGQERLGYGKWLAMLLAALSIFRRYPVVKVVIDTGDRAVRRTTPFVFVGNNWYQIQSFSLGGRSCLNQGELSLYLANRTGRLGLLALALRALVGRLDQARDFESMCLSELRIETMKKTLRVALDGEVTRLAPPLHYRIRRGALRVFVP